MVIIFKYLPNNRNLRNTHLKNKIKCHNMYVFFHIHKINQG